MNIRQQDWGMSFHHRPFSSEGFQFLCLLIWLINRCQFWKSRLLHVHHFLFLNTIKYYRGLCRWFIFVFSDCHHFSINHTRSWSLFWPTHSNIFCNIMLFVQFCKKFALGVFPFLFHFLFFTVIRKLSFILQYEQFMIQIKFKLNPQLN